MALERPASTPRCSSFLIAGNSRLTSTPPKIVLAMRIRHESSGPIL
jgi:hypothetical protein